MAPIAWPVADAAAGQEGAADLRPVVAAGAAVDSRRAAELAPGDDRHVVEHAANFQVFDQGAQALVELGAVVAHQAEVVAVRVPAAVGERHATDAGLDQPARDQQMLVDRRCTVVLELVRLAVAVAVAKPGIFPAQVEGVDQPAGGQDVEGELGRRVDAGERTRGVAVAFQPVEAGQQPAAIVELSGRDPQLHVGHRRPVRLERGVRRPEEPGRTRVGPGAVLGSRGQADERRDGRVDGPLQLRRPSRPGSAGRRSIARLSGSQPVLHWNASWRSVAPTTERITAALSIRPASCGKTSQISMPGTLVAIGLNSPRISAGASVLISHMSWCGGPPPRKMLITALCEDRVPARASARNKSARDNDIRLPIERPPMRMKSRRRIPSQNDEVSLEPKIVSIQSSSRKVSSFNTFRLVVMQ